MGPLWSPAQLLIKESIQRDFQNGQLKKMPNFWYFAKETSSCFSPYRLNGNSSRKCHSSWNQEIIDNAECTTINWRRNMVILMTLPGSYVRSILPFQISSPFISHHSRSRNIDSTSIKIQNKQTSSEHLMLTRLRVTNWTEG